MPATKPRATAKRPLKVFKLFSTPGKWTRYADARTADNVATDCNDVEACKFCARGGVMACYFPNVGNIYDFRVMEPDFKQFQGMIKKLAEAIKKLRPGFVKKLQMKDDMNIVLQYNDSRGRKVADILQVFREAGL